MSVSSRLTSLRRLVVPERHRVETDADFATLDRWLAEHQRGTDGVATIFRSSRRVVVLVGPISNTDMAGYVWKARIPPTPTSSSETVVLSGRIRPYLPMYAGCAVSLALVPISVVASTVLATPTERIVALSAAVGVVAMFWAPLFTSNAKGKRELVVQLLRDVLPPSAEGSQSAGAQSGF